MNRVSHVTPRMVLARYGWHEVDCDFEGYHRYEKIDGGDLDFVVLIDGLTPQEMDKAIGWCDLTPSLTYVPMEPVRGSALP